MKFLNRSEELSLLERRLAGKAAELLVLYGRRRVGKTELLANVASRARSVYFEATDTVAVEQLRDLSGEVGRSLGNALLERQPATSWEALLLTLSESIGRNERTLVVLDEFQLLAKRSPELETALSRWWRTTGRRLPLMLVLAGSEVSFFEDSVLAGQLYGRRTGQLKVLPFSPRHAALFHPAYSFEDRVRTFSVCGGIPFYLERFTDEQPLEEHLLNEVFFRTGLLHDEAELLLRQSLSDPTNHIAVLRAIAHGYNRNSTMSDRTQLAPAHVAKVLGSLEAVGLIERLRPVTASVRAKKTAFAICDPFLRFHYRFVEPARSQLRTQELARCYVKDVVVPTLDHHVSRVWEEICRDFVLRKAPGLVEVGRWWGQAPTGQGRQTEEREIDVVGVDASRTPRAVGMCKWTKARMDFDVLNLLDRLTPYLGSSSTSPERYLFSRSGFTKRLATYASGDDSVHLVTPADIYAKA